MPPKHLLLVHGRATKPARQEKERLVKQALLHGLERVSARAAEAVRSGRVATSLAYYGDINNRLVLAAQPRLRAHMVQVDGVWYERDGSYDRDLEKLLARPTGEHSAEAYARLLREVPDRSWRDEVARVGGAILNFLGLGRRTLIARLPDLGRYITSRVEGSAIRERLQEPLKEALVTTGDVAIVAHSMGCMVSYDVLWKLSRMSEYRHYRDREVSLWLTLGSPLGEPAIQRGLYDADEPADGRYPTNIRRWVNIAARDDYVAHDGSIADDFREMVRRGLIGAEAIVDRPRICNLWVGTDGSNPHKLYGYLEHPEVAREIAAWIEQP
jgi:hypothetical protein